MAFYMSISEVATVIDDTNLYEYFSEDDSYFYSFNWSGAAFVAQPSSTSSGELYITLYASKNINSLTFNYGLDKSTNTSTSYYFKIIRGEVGSGETVASLTETETGSCVIQNIQAGEIIDISFKYASNSTSWSSWFTMTAGANNPSGVARKAKKMYVGVDTQVPVYEDTIVDINGTNFANYFKIAQSSGLSSDIDETKFILDGNNSFVEMSTFYNETYFLPPEIVEVKINYNLDTGSDVGTYGTSGLFIWDFSVSEYEPAVQVYSTASGSYSPGIIENESGRGVAFSVTFTKEAENWEAYFTLQIVTRQQTGTTWAGVARKIKKLYMGVAGIARKVFGGGEVSYYGNSTDGTLTGLNSNRLDLAGATIGGYAVFAGGRTYPGNSYSVNTVEAYNEQLTKSLPTALGTKRHYLGGASNTNYAIFAVGTNNSSVTGAVDAYNSSLTQSSLSTQTSRRDTASLGFGDYCIFAGGVNGSTYYKTAYFYDNSLTRTTNSSFFATSRSKSGSASINNYGLFGGGYNGSYLNNIKVIDSSLTDVSGVSSLNSIYGYQGASTATHAIFGTGSDESGTSNAKALGTAYDSSLTKIDIMFSVRRSMSMATASFDDCCIFAGGGSPNKSVVDGFDTSLTCQTYTSLSVGVSDNASAVLGDYAIFAGGYTATTYQISSAVEVYQVS